MINNTIFYFIVIITIALLYNYLVHIINSVLYKNYSYAEKNIYTIITLVIFSILGFVLYFTMQNKSKLISDGMLLASILLLLTALFTNWDNMAGELKIVGVLTMLGLFGYWIWIYEKQQTKLSKNNKSKLLTKNKNVDDKNNNKALNTNGSNNNNNGGNNNGNDNEYSNIQNMFLNNIIY